MNIKEKLIKAIKNPKLILVRLDKKNIIRLSDRKFLELQFQNKMERKLDLNNPQTFNEKLQWLKLYDRKPEYTKMVDKFEAKGYVSGIIGEEYIIPTIDVYDNFSDIDFERLPMQFVIKCTHDSGGLVICKDKEKLDKDMARKKIEKSLAQNYYYSNREWPYKNVKPRIIIEKYMATEKQPELIDYKWFCFNGEPKYLYVSEGLSDHSTAKISFVDMEYNKMEFYRKDYKPFEKLPPKPINFDKMKELARHLSKNIPFLRVDFYEVDGKIYFSELTFFPCSGFIPFEPQGYDRVLGEMLILPKEKIEDKDEK